MLGLSFRLLATLSSGQSGRLGGGSGSAFGRIAFRTRIVRSVGRAEQLLPARPFPGAYLLGLRTFYSRRTEDKYVWFNFPSAFHTIEGRHALPPGGDRCWPATSRVPCPARFHLFGLLVWRYKIFQDVHGQCRHGFGHARPCEPFVCPRCFRPLHVRVGNPDLQNSWRYNFRTEFLHRSPEKKWFTQVNVNAWQGVNDVAQGFSYNSETGCTPTVRRTWTATGASMEVWHFRKEGMAEYWNVGANLNYDFHRSVDLSSVEG